MTWPASVSVRPLSRGHLCGTRWPGLSGRSGGLPRHSSICARPRTSQKRRLTSTRFSGPLFTFGALKVDQGDFVGALAPLRARLAICAGRGRSSTCCLISPGRWARRITGPAVASRGSPSWRKRPRASPGAAASGGWMGGPRRGAWRRVPSGPEASGRDPESPRKGLRSARHRGTGRSKLLLVRYARRHRGPSRPRSRSRPREAHYRQALALAEALGLRPLIAHCHLGLGKLYRRTDKREPAQEHLTTATTMYRDMSMTYWREKAEAEMAELG